MLLQYDNFPINDIPFEDEIYYVRITEGKGLRDGGKK